MNTSLSFNEALLITDNAFKPLQCIAWTLQEGTGEVSISVMDTFANPVISSYSIPSHVLTSSSLLNKVLSEKRQQLQQQGLKLNVWSMPR